jgi:hypothetical protein
MDYQSGRAQETRGKGDTEKIGKERNIISIFKRR